MLAAPFPYTRAYRSENSTRRYQGLVKDRYGLPNDDTEQLREGLKHKLYMDYIFEGKICSAPIGDHPQKIVDLGTGFGFWASDGSSCPFLTTPLPSRIPAYYIAQLLKSTPAHASSGPTSPPSSPCGLHRMSSSTWKTSRMRSGRGRAYTAARTCFSSGPRSRLSATRAA